jgi:hypothetical protein
MRYSGVKVTGVSGAVIVKMNVEFDPGETLVPAGIVTRTGPNLAASPAPSPTAPRRIIVVSFQAMLPVFFMVTETGYLWPVFMVTGRDVATS